jgi:hypothetical protein
MQLHGAVLSRLVLTLPEIQGLISETLITTTTISTMATLSTPLPSSAI